MNTIEVLIALMLMIGIVGVAVQVQLQSTKIVGNSRLHEKVAAKRAYSVRSTGISSGVVAGAFEGYRRWYL